MHLPAPDGYTLGAELGRGANGVVVAAVHDASQVAVALKRVVAETPKLRAGLHQEVLAMARLNHPNLLFLYDAGVIEPSGGGPATVWMATELASGGSLADRVLPDFDAVREVLEPLLAGLAHAHARGVLHRDLKPANLLFATAADRRPGLKIADFGLSSVRGEDTVFRRGGTPSYIPPEQVSGDAAGPWSDVYALGAVLWALVCGAPPFVGPPNVVVRMHQRAPLPAFMPRFDVPEGFGALLAEMCSKAPGDRPTVAEVQAALFQRPVSVARAFARADAASARAPGLGAELVPLRDWRLVGRRAERERLIGALTDVVRDGRPSVVAVTGPSGIGKTRLARWLAETAAEAGVAALLWQPADTGAALARAAKGPVVAVFDALDATAEATLATLAFAPWPILVVATCAALPDDLELLPRFVHVPLGPLSPTAFRDLLVEELGLTRPDAMRAAAVCPPSPGAAVAWAAQLSRARVLRSTPEGYALPGAVPAPAPLQGPLTGASGPLRLAALLGDVIPAERLRAVLALAGFAPPVADFERLARAGWLAPHPDGLRWTTPSPASQLTPPPTPAEHRFVAAALADDPNPDARVARGLHLLAAGDLAAARALLLVHDPDASAPALERLRRSVEAAQPHLAGATPAERAAFLVMDLRVQLNLVGSGHALAAADRVAEALSDPVPGVPEPLRHEALRVAALVYVFERRPEGLLLLDRIPSSAGSLRIRAIDAAADGALDASIALQERALAAATEPDLQGRIANGLGGAHGKAGRHDVAIRWFRAAVELLDVGVRHIPLRNIAVSQILLGRYDEALAALREADHLPHLGAETQGQGPPLRAIAAALANRDDEVERVADHALFVLRRRAPDSLPVLLDVIRAARPTAPASRRFMEAVRGVVG